MLLKSLLRRLNYLRTYRNRSKRRSPGDTLLPLPVSVNSTPSQRLYHKSVSQGVLARFKSETLPSLIRASTAPLSTDSEGSGGSQVPLDSVSDFDFDMENDGRVPPGLVIGTDELSQHLLTNLYPGHSDPSLKSILEASTLQHVFNTIESVAATNALTPLHSSQALATLWDLQKLAFQVGYVFEGDPNSNTKRQRFTQSLKQHPTFQKILDHVLSNVAELQDEPIAACLLCLAKFDFTIKSDPSQILLRELDTRRINLPLPAVSRISVAVRNEGLYGSLVIASMLPRMATLIQEVSTGHEMRLASIALRSANKCLPPRILQLYYDKVSSFLDSGQLREVDSSVYCKILLCLNDTKWIQRCHEIGKSRECQELQRAVGQLLAPKVKDLPVIDVVSLQRILEYGSQEPPELIDALNSRIGRLIEEQVENPPLDLFSSLSPATRRSLNQRKQLASFMTDYLNNYPDFWEIYPGLFRVIRALKLAEADDTGKVYEKFWTKATHLLTLESHDPAKVLKLAYDYLSFGSGSSFTMRHIQFESKAKQLLYFYIYNYINQQQPTLISPNDFAKAYAFLLAYSWHAEPIFQEKGHGLWQLFQENFQKGIRPLEVLIMARGISVSLNNQTRHTRSSSRYLDQIHNFQQSLEDTTDLFLSEEPNEWPVSELIFLVKAQATLRRASTESATFRKTIQLFCNRATVEQFDSKEGRDLVIGLSGTNYNDPTITSFLLDFIHTNTTSISPEFAQRFLSYGFHCGIEPQSPRDTAAFQATYDVISSHWESLSTFGLLQAALMLSLTQCLQPPLVQYIFSTEFLNRLDEDVKSSAANSSYPLKLRKLYMELNRAVCLDLPNANVPWFHQKYCETVYSAVLPREIQNPLEKEVEASLREVLNDDTAIQTNVLTPYFYDIDFVIEFDERGKPVKKGRGKRLLSLPTLRRQPEQTPKVTQSVAILILPESAFSSHFRSLRGFYQLRKRHLEILGYRVVHIDPQHWNAMHMTEVGRAEYLENAIFPNYQASLPPKGSPSSSSSLDFITSS